MLRDFGTAPFDVPIHVSCLLPHDATRRVFFPPQQQPQQPQQQPQASTASRAVLTDQQPSTGTAAHGATIDAGDDSDDGEQLRSQSLPDDQEYDFDPSTTSTAEGAAFLLARELLTELSPNMTSFARMDGPTADLYRRVLLDIFHLIDRIKVPMHHSFKKAFFAAYREAFLIFDSEILAVVKATLREKHQMTDAQIEEKMLFDFDYFRERVPRYAPGGRLLYARVKYVFDAFGCKKDLTTGKPLFNDRAWDKPTEILKQIGGGYGSDPPDVPMYTHKLDPKTGRPMVDADGLFLYKSLRGTNAVERFHRKLIECFGSWHCGIELAVGLLAEFLHRHNHDQAVLNVPEYLNE